MSNGASPREGTLHAAKCWPARVRPLPGAGSDQRGTKVRRVCYFSPAPRIPRSEGWVPSFCLGTFPPEEVGTRDSGRLPRSLNPRLARCQEGTQTEGRGCHPSRCAARRPPPAARARCPLGWSPPPGHPDADPAYPAFPRCLAHAWPSALSPRRMPDIFMYEILRNKFKNRRIVTSQSIKGFYK